MNLSCFHFEPNPNHFAKKKVFFPRLVSGALAGVTAGDFVGVGIGLPVKKK